MEADPFDSVVVPRGATCQTRGRAPITKPTRKGATPVTILASLVSLSATVALCVTAVQMQALRKRIEELERKQR